MIKIAKRPLFSPALEFSLVCIIYGIAPIYLERARHVFGIPALVFFYCGLVIIAGAMAHRAYARRYQALHSLQDVREKINIVRNASEVDAVSHSSVSARIIRYDNLKKIIEQASSSFDLDVIADHLVELTQTLFGAKRSSCLLYLVNPALGRLQLFKSKKDDPHQAIKAKEGDLFDQWVAKHASPLLVENSKDDFRFDPEKAGCHESRPIASLASAPFVVENRFLGILRLDSPLAQAFTLDDLRLLAAIADIGAVALENGELFKKTQELAIHDGLTGLFTKGHFLERLEGEVRRSTRAASALSLLMCDIDHFKIYNDTYGHIAGDIVLKKLSAVITDCLKRAEAVISRFGGEEFCILLPNADIGQAHALAEDLRLRVAAVPVNLRKQITSVTVSIGVATLAVHGHDADALIMKADRAMYEAKEKGRNRVMDAR